ncbi:DUF1826 domain-containing protein [Shimia isoporae]|uniref:DUF1826 domain-containing protein n=1 Tax=Shimia isoporae TaxID=647720 RepID=UPI00244199FC|nr:DUF1826 domain-containing protein [Shimia isoporae]
MTCRPRPACIWHHRATGLPTSKYNDPEEILTAPTGGAMVLRGTLSEGLSNPSLRHRSPPIEGSGEVRSVLVVDPVEDSASEL